MKVPNFGPSFTVEILEKQELSTEETERKNEPILMGNDKSLLTAA